jgi:uncharacterized protein YkwD
MRRRKAPKKREKNDAGSFSPRFLKNSTYLATTALVVCLFVAAGAVDRIVKELGSPYVAAVISAVLVDLANEDRAELALPKLTTNPLLTAAAQAKANDMAQKGYFSHTTPEGYDSWHWFKQVGYDYRFAGENLAVNFSDSADVEAAWMASPTHRDNIVSPRYTEIGIATAVGMYQGRETVFVVQMFGMPKDASAAAPSVTPAEVAAAPVEVPDVLGETTVIAPHEDEPVGALAEQDGDASVIVAEDEIPFWAYLVAQPKQTLQYAYYIIGLLILFALFFDVEWEIKHHHVKHAMKAGVVLGTMSMLFVVADWVFFAEPVLAVLGAFL